MCVLRENTYSKSNLATVANFMRANLTGTHVQCPWAIVDICISFCTWNNAAYFWPGLYEARNIKTF